MVRDSQCPVSSTCEVGCKEILYEAGNVVILAVFRGQARARGGNSSNALSERSDDGLIRTDQAAENDRDLTKARLALDSSRRHARPVSRVQIRCHPDAHRRGSCKRWGGTCSNCGPTDASPHWVTGDPNRRPDPANGIIGYNRRYQSSGHRPSTLSIITNAEFNLGVGLRRIVGSDRNPKHADTIIAGGVRRYAAGY